LLRCDIDCLTFVLQSNPLDMMDRCGGRKIKRVLENDGVLKAIFNLDPILIGNKALVNRYLNGSVDRI